MWLATASDNWLANYNTAVETLPDLTRVENSLQCHEPVASCAIYLMTVNKVTATRNVTFLPPRYSMLLLLPYHCVHLIGAVFAEVSAPRGPSFGCWQNAAYTQFINVSYWIARLPPGPLNPQKSLFKHLFPNVPNYL